MFLGLLLHTLSIRTLLGDFLFNFSLSFFLGQFLLFLFALFKIPWIRYLYLLSSFDDLILLLVVPNSWTALFLFWWWLNSLLRFDILFLQLFRDWLMRLNRYLFFRCQDVFMFIFFLGLLSQSIDFIRLLWQTICLCLVVILFFISFYLDLLISLIDRFLGDCRLGFLFFDELYLFWFNILMLFYLFHRLGYFFASYHCWGKVVWIIDASQLVDFDLPFWD